MYDNSLEDLFNDQDIVLKWEIRTNNITKLQSVIDLVRNQASIDAKVLIVKVYDKYPLIKASGKRNALDGFKEKLQKLGVQIKELE
jgi:hypothetical protein